MLGVLPTIMASKSGSHGALPGKGPGTQLHCPVSEKSLRLTSPCPVPLSVPRVPTSIIRLSHKPTQAVSLSSLFSQPLSPLSAAKTLPHQLGPSRGSCYFTPASNSSVASLGSQDKGQNPYQNLEALHVLAPAYLSNIPPPHDPALLQLHCHLQPFWPQGLGTCHSLDPAHSSPG